MENKNMPDMALSNGKAASAFLFASSSIKWLELLLPSMIARR